MMILKICLVFCAYLSFSNAILGYNSYEFALQEFKDELKRELEQNILSSLQRRLSVRNSLLNHSN